MAVTVVTRGSETPVEGATLEADGATASTDPAGTATLSALRGATISVTADGHDPGEATVPDEGDLAIELAHRPREQAKDVGWADLFTASRWNER